MDLGDLLGFIANELGSLCLLIGVLAGMALMRWAAQHYQRICRQHGTALASCGMTGELVAQRLLAAAGLSEIGLVRSRRRSFYHPRKGQIHLSAVTFDSPSLLALTTAAHEVGHAQLPAGDCRPP
ncbi:MAG TPA: zinc metallopeptidase [Gemmataceae bacterium]|nr:zinc metallopeptidase [Gemmataceae bacterium]